MIFHCSLSVAAVLLSVSSTAAQVYDRPLDFVYALQHGKPLKYSDEQFLSYFEQVKPGITSLVSFFLNVDDLTKSQSMIDSVKQKNITIIPAVGGGGQDNLNSPTYQNIAKVYKTFTDYIRLEVGVNGNIDEIQGLIDYCVSIGFQHIMLNPWPHEAGGSAVNFKNPEVDSAYIQVLLDENGQTEEPIPSSTNWYPGNQNEIKSLLSIKPNATILINYESAPQQDALTNIEKAQKGASITAMNITINQINDQYKSEGLHWIPPMDKAYDPIALDTWYWIVEQLNQM